MRQFILRAKCQRLTQNQTSCNSVVRPLRGKILNTSYYTLVAHFTSAKEEWPYYQIPMEELCDATRFSDGCGGRVRECADWHGQDPNGNRKKHSSSTTASVVTNHSFWEEEAFRCLYYTETKQPVSHQEILQHRSCTLVHGSLQTASLIRDQLCTSARPPV